MVTQRIALEDINDALDSMEAGVGARSMVVFE
jgi:Zn-dependent alcohol dehydrogenase